MQRHASLKLSQCVVLSFFDRILGVSPPQLHCSGGLVITFCGQFMCLENHILFEEPWMSFQLLYFLSPVLKILSRSVQAWLRGVVTHFQLSYECMHASTAAPRQR